MLPALPDVAAFLFAYLLFTFGPGAAAGLALTASFDPLRRFVILLGIGCATAPILIDALGRLHLLAAFPYVASAMAGAAVAGWTWRSAGRERTDRADLIACVVVLGVALAAGAIAFWHRLVLTPREATVYGLYDSVDLSFYAAWASEASHTVPPTASYYAGHLLNAAYYPQLVLAMAHRFAGVPMLAIYFRYAWPTFLAVGGLTAFVLVRSLASRGVALLAVLLIVLGGDFSYLAAWLLPHATSDWDFLLWPTNFFAPTAEVLHFNTWAPTLAVMFTALFAIVRSVEERSRGWTVLGALMLATLFQFKPFAFAVLVAGLAAASIFSGRDRVARWRFATTLGLGVLFVLPCVYAVTSVGADRRSRLLIDFFMLPQRMLIKLDLAGAFSALPKPVLIAAATALFFLVGLGIRWVAIGEVWRAIRSTAGSHAAAWRLFAWSAVAGVATPFVLVTDPYVDTLQFYQTGLYLLWIFAAAALVSFARGRGTAGRVAIVLAIALAMPSTVHFFAMKWTDNRRPPLVGLTAGDMAVAKYLETTDPETTVILHDRPSSPSLMTVVSARRVVLGWGMRYYAVGSEGRREEVDAFYGSADGSPDQARETLRRYHVTHVVVHGDRDRVHPAVLAELQPVVRSGQVTLYAVPQM